MSSHDNRSRHDRPIRSISNEDAGSAVDNGASDSLTPKSGPDSSLLLANGREVSVKLLAPLLQEIVRGKKYDPLAQGLEYRVYTSTELEGAVFKLATKPSPHTQLVVHSLRPNRAEAAAIADELVCDERAVPFVQVPLTIPVQSVRTGEVREESVEMIVQRKVRTVDRCWQSNKKDSHSVSVIARDLTAFHKDLIRAGYVDADLNSIKNVGYDTISQPTESLKLIDLGFVFRLPTEPAARAAAFASHGDATHPTLGEFLAGSIFYQFYEKALKDKEVRQVFTTLVKELFPALETAEMNALHTAYGAASTHIRSLPRDERVRAYIGLLRAPETADLINKVLAKLCR